jgi:hypothetical protein
VEGNIARATVPNAAKKSQYRLMRMLLAMNAEDIIQRKIVVNGAIDLI